MSRYQVLAIPRPEGWEPASADDVPPEPGRPLGVLEEFDRLFPAVGAAIRYNQGPEGPASGRWAVVVDPTVAGRLWPEARLCTPLSYRVGTLWWPEGWEPESPLDVPNCVLWAEGASGGEPMNGCQEAVDTVRGLNEQCMGHPTTTWYMVVAVENEPVRRPVGEAGTVDVWPEHLVRPEEGGGRGDCSACPARDFPCARGETLETTGPSGP